MKQNYNRKDTKLIINRNVLQFFLWECLKSLLTAKMQIFFAKDAKKKNIFL